MKKPALRSRAVLPQPSGSSSLTHGAILLFFRVPAKLPSVKGKAWRVFAFRDHAADAPRRARTRARRRQRRAPGARFEGWAGALGGGGDRGRHLSGLTATIPVGIDHP